MNRIKTFFLFTMVLILCLPLIIPAQEKMQDVVYLKNGSVIRGIIIEQVPNVSVKIQTADGSMFFYEMNEILKLTKEPAIVKPAGSGEQTWNAGIKAGVLFPGEVFIEAADAWLDTETGWMINITADFMVAPKLSIGGFLLHSSTTDATFGESANVNTFGGTIKGRFKTANGIQFRPGVALGYQLTSGNEFEEVTGFGIGALLEVAFPIGGGRRITGEFSFISQPSGGNDDTEVTFPPIFYLAIGIEFGD